MGCVAERHWKADEWPQESGEEVEFTLVYEGELFAYKEDRAAHKHAIRRQFHPQLKQVWESKLPHWISSTRPSRMIRRIDAGSPILQQVASRFAICGYRFVPLVLEELVLACKLDILFLRREIGLGRIVQGGDLDNRLKTLFDGLRVPHDGKEIGGSAPLEGEDPFFCLLQDDSLITEVKVRADTLLTPTTPQTANDVKLIIGVTLRPLEMTEYNGDFA